MFAFKYPGFSLIKPWLLILPVLGGGEDFPLSLNRAPFFKMDMAFKKNYFRFCHMLY